jgi:hypothetical protein
MDTIADRIAGSESPDIAPAGGDLEARKLAMWSYAGFGLGIILSFASTAYLVGNDNYHNLPFLVFYLSWWPPLNLILFRRMARPRGTSRPKWKLPQFRTQSLMMVVAYVAVLCGLSVQLVPLGAKAGQYRQKWLLADSMAKVYRPIALKSAVEASQKRQAVEQLHAGKIPESLFPGQREFLRSLETDPKSTPEYREYRRGLITDGEEQWGIRQERNAFVVGRLADYYERLAAKYEKARRRPWLPVQPDPPMPPMQ